MSAYRVLVVDDNHEIRRMVTASLKTLGDDIDVLDVPSAEEALFISASVPLDLIVLDFRLPGMSGLEMVTRLRRRKPGMKIILVTGVEDEASRKQVAEAGVDAYFFKPIEIGAFLDAVKHVLWPEPETATGGSAAPAFIDVSSIRSEPGVSGEPNAVDKPTGGEVPAVSSKPGPVRAASNSQVPPLTGKPPVGTVPNAGGAPSVSEAPAIKGKSPINVAPSAPSANSTPAIKEKTTTPAVRFQPTLDERISALKQQLKATTVLLLNDAGQVVEIAGNPSQVTAGSGLLPAMMEVFHASQKVYAVSGRGATESLLCFTSGRLHFYLTPVDDSHALLAAASGLLEPDMLGLIDRAIQLAVQDLRAILGRKHEEESHKQAEQEAAQAALPADVSVDADTLAVIDELFSQAPRKGGKSKAEGFWDALEEKGEMDVTGGKDVISYDEARKLGLALGEEEQP